MNRPAQLPEAIEHHIGGRHVPAAGGATFEVADPVSNRPYARATILNRVADGIEVRHLRRRGPGRGGGLRPVRDDVAQRGTVHGGVAGPRRAARPRFRRLPAGGLGREGGQHSIDFYTESRIVHVALGDTHVPRFGA